MAITVRFQFIHRLKNPWLAFFHLFGCFWQTSVVCVNPQCTHKPKKILGPPKICLVPWQQFGGCICWGITENIVFGF